MIVDFLGVLFKLAAFKFQAVVSLIIIVVNVLRLFLGLPGARLVMLAIISLLNVRTVTIVLLDCVFAHKDNHGAQLLSRVLIFHLAAQLTITAELALLSSEELAGVLLIINVTQYPLTAH